MPTRTAAEIKRQVEGLQKQKIGLPIVNFFGDDNHKPIDAQIRIIQGKSRAENYEGVNDMIYSMALDAEEWLDGEREEDLFDEE